MQTQVERIYQGVGKINKQASLEITSQYCQKGQLHKQQKKNAQSRSIRKHEIVSIL